MAQQLIVLMSDMQWQILRFAGMQYLETRIFSVHEENQQSLLNWIKQFPSASVAFLTDIADEHYHVEILPHVSGTARKQLLDRRLAAWPLVQELHTIHYIDSVQGSRREDRYLFSAIHYPPLRHCLQGLQQQGTRVQGVYSQALCLPCWLPANKTHCLYAGVEKRQLRLSYLYQSRLLFSRLLILPAEIAVTAHIMNEVIQTRFHLISQHWLQESESLHLLWSSDDNAMSDWSQQQWPAQIQLTNIAGKEIAEVTIPAPVSITARMAVQVILSSRQLPNLAPPEALMHARIALGKRVISCACVVMACLFALTAWSGYRQLQHTRHAIQIVRNNILRWQTETPAPDIPEAALPQLHTTALAIQALETSARLPDRSLQILQQTIAGLQHWQLQQLAWQYGAVTGKNGQSDHDWSERISLSFARKGEAASINARQDWQQLLERLRSHPDIAKVTETRLPDTSANPVLHGDTRQMLETGDQQQVDIRLHQNRKPA